MTAAVTVFTYGDPDPERASRLGAYLLGASQGNGAEVLGSSFSAEPSGLWGDSAEACGALVVAGLRRAEAIRIGARGAELFGQDAVGVVHDPEGRTLATPGAEDLSTAAEVWA